MGSGSLHLRHEVHEHYGVDPQRQQGENQYDDRNDRGGVTKGLRRGGLPIDDWSVMHGSGIPGFVRFYSRRGRPL